ncbi:MAG: aminomethyl-transferring glycine dehydrogenase subunit GcvPA, partial [Bacteroidales bacterium]|nr:aminomethyl-transferring glycine dehydrogenase subunit GcvPA [Bacteroidales bacterium]
MITNNFAHRHNGPQPAEVEKMLKVIGVSSIDELIDKTIPAKIRFKQPLDLPQGMNEYEYFTMLKGMASKNKMYETYIGQGYYNTIVPAVLQRNILENPGWYTSYTPYQAEISQGRLETLFTFQTMICSMTAMPLANASLLDEATACAEAMLMFYGSRSRQQQKDNVNKFFVSENLFSQSIDVIKTRAVPRGIEVVVGSDDTVLDSTFFGAIVQYPNRKGEVLDYAAFTADAKAKGIFVAVAADLMSLALLTPPGEWGADCVCGTTQRFGCPMSFGGPSAAYFACTENFKRTMPGRIIGQTVDAQGNKAFRLALQTREQHIKREKATSNICTAQALVAIMAGQYAAYHGQEGVREIAQDINKTATTIAEKAKTYGYTQLNETYFDTIRLACPVEAEKVCKIAVENKINFLLIDNKTIGISTDETTSCQGVERVLRVLAQAAGKEFVEFSCAEPKGIPANLKRQSAFLTQKVFSSYHSETEMMRYLKKMEVKDLSLNRAMIPLGSCTMKLNAAMEMIPFTWAEFANVHPFVPRNQAEGYYELVEDMDRILSKITGFAKVSLQPNSGA